MSTFAHSGRITSTTSHWVVDDEGFGRKMGSGRKAEWWTETIDEFLVAMRSEAYDMVNAPDDAEDLHGDARSLAERFLALDDWLSSGRRRLPKSWWTTDAEQEGQS